MRAILVIASLWLMLAYRSVSAAEDSQPVLPRYSFDTGRQLTYTGHGEFKYEHGSFVSTTIVQLTVVARNADGSFQVICRSASQEVQKREGQNAAPAQPEEVRYTSFNIFPDGKIVSDASASEQTSQPVLPKLPSDAQQLHATWEEPSTFGDSTDIFRSGDRRGSVWTFTSSQDGLMKKIYGITNDCIYKFDMSKGIVTSVTAEARQEYGFKGSGSSSDELQSDTTLPADQIAVLVKDFATLQAAQKAFGAKIESVDKAPDDSNAILASAREDVTTAAATVTTPDIKKQVEALASGADEQIKYEQDQAKRIAAVVGKHAPDFTAEDLDGKPHKLRDYRGKVVVLDFWYRGCGWCMRAMPQVNQLAGDFKDRSVAVIGLNTDRDVNDAKFVVDALGLNYTTLRIGQETVSQFQVQGFPTMILIDPNGVVRDFHVGYSPTLRADIGKKVQEILDAKK